MMCFLTIFRSDFFNAIIPNVAVPQLVNKLFGLGIVLVSYIVGKFTLYLCINLKANAILKRAVLIRRTHLCVGPAKHGAGAGGEGPNDRFFNKGL